ncbi:small subunit ribosomal protein S16 [Catalinimonas alkaloidigena]|uniref:Small ribosomal subunit protein bS16 n=1 Tax=Catalinimonas alkaloidigena TaxID=1075417 RepID=A0A1G9M2H8_9BACT|nr:30S ribosomal protein S16 [Catalinimonas alkaloidigena]SDL68408.1 small subunit ribosomal protein S16 [Catalinimonas alkaloidigena]
MPLKIRLTRRGRKKLALFDVVVADSRSPRDGRFVEKIGTYNPNTNPATIDLNEDKALQWLQNGAQPSDTVRAMLSYKGVLLRRHLQAGVRKGALTAEQADEKFATWKEEKEAKITGKVDQLAQKRADAQKARLAAEAKVNEARAEAQRKREEEARAAAEAESAAANAEGGEEGEAEAPAEETQE